MNFPHSWKGASMKFTFVAITAFCLLLCGCNSRAKLEAQRAALVRNLEHVQFERSNADFDKRSAELAKEAERDDLALYAAGGTPDTDATAKRIRDAKDPETIEHEEEDATAHLHRAQAALEAFDVALSEIAEKE
jgi:histidyl-tRNA synthetase